MEHRKFTPSNFREFHPGGNLGAQLSRVKDIMHTNDLLPLTDLDTPMAEVLINMSKKGFGIVGVLNKQSNLLGIITDGDLRRNMDTLLDMSAEEVMTINPQVIESKSFLVEALEIMNSKKITCLFVVEENKPIGIIHIHDCLRAGIKQK
jgi:arabinose-5-phosphate isomerase|tara:strand:- start:299 stop:745 length:447 start_codon:yes stop_codon:yes gene_type:complete